MTRKPPTNLTVRASWPRPKGGSGWYPGIWVVCALAGAALIGGCSQPVTWGLAASQPGGAGDLPGIAGPIEVRFYTPGEDGPADVHPTGSIDSWVRLRRPRLAPASTTGEREGNYTILSLNPGTYEFEYLVPHRPEQLLYGEMDVRMVWTRWAADFIRRTFLMVSPGGGSGEYGHPSILSEDDLRRVYAGDMVTKLVFVADLKAVDGRIVKIDREIRRLQDEEQRLASQEEYWAVKLADRRRNAFYFGSYGDDTPSVHLSLYQLAIGPEAYHWKRFSEADDRMRTYREKLASLRLPIERLREERTALRALLANVKVLHRQGDLILATPEMIRRYHDQDDEITEGRYTLQGPYPGVDAPYWFSEVAQTVHWPHLLSWLGIYPRLIETTNRMETRLERIGELVMVVRIGSREPWSLKSTSRTPIFRAR